MHCVPEGATRNMKEEEQQHLLFWDFDEWLFKINKLTPFRPDLWYHNRESLQRMNFFLC
jgi:hypothetical protein